MDLANGTTALHGICVLLPWRGDERVRARDATGACFWPIRQVEKAQAHRHTQYKEFDFGDIVVRPLSGP